MNMEKFNTMKEDLFDLEDEDMIEPLVEEYRNVLRDNNYKEYNLAQEMIDLYCTYSNGFKIEWIANDNEDIRGKINFIEMEKILGDWKGIILFTGMNHCNYQN